MESPISDRITYRNKPDFRNKMGRLLWGIVWTLLIRPLPRSSCRLWKILIFRAFGAKIHKKAVIYSSANVYMPQNLEMRAFATLGPKVDCYNVDKVILGEHVIISQKSYLCTPSHDLSRADLPLISAPIVLEDYVWIGSDVFIGMGVKVGQGAVIGARSSVFRDVEPWVVVGGNPARFIKKRTIQEP